MNTEAAAAPRPLSTPVPADSDLAPTGCNVPQEGSEAEGEVPVNADFLVLDKERVRLGRAGVPMQPRPRIADTSQEDGLKAEVRFQAWARAMWPSAVVHASCALDNQQQHWDVLLQSPEAAASDVPEGVRVDVKAPRKLARRDRAAATTHTWIELQSAKAAHRGSLFGDAEMLAFEQPGGRPEWLLVARHQLAQLIMGMLSVAGMTLTTDRAEAVAKRASVSAPFAVYQRRGRERLLWFPMAVLDKLAWSPAALTNLRSVERAFAKVATRQQQVAAMQLAAGRSGSVGKG